MGWIFSGVPSWEEAWDILLVLLVGCAIWSLSYRKVLFIASPATGRALWMGCFVYAATQFLSNHAEAQGILLFAAWTVAWEAKQQKQWRILVAAVVVKFVLFLSFFW